MREPGRAWSQARNQGRGQAVLRARRFLENIWSTLLLFSIKQGSEMSGAV